MSGTLRLILGDQLSCEMSSLSDIDKANDTVLIVEVWEEATYVRHHKKKIAFLFSAMRHFAEDLCGQGVSVRYIKLNDPENTGSFTGEVARAIALVQPVNFVVTEPGEWRVLEMMQHWREELQVPVEIREDKRFLCSAASFNKWANGKKSFRMEFFYREMRRAHKILMRGDEPEGGQWNFDAENRAKLPDSVTLPNHPLFTPDQITKECIELVRAKFPTHFGDLEPFTMPVKRADALIVLDTFIEERLPLFGKYQDAMKQGEPKLFHSMISALLNCGLLSPLEIMKKAELAYYSGHAPLNSVEGFIRQILGWREYVRGLYWLKMPDYAKTNALNATRALPDLYWSGETYMNCMRQVIEETRQNAHAHHIQRLMITGNFALLAGINPYEIEAWYLSVYSDAYDWVELPNTHGMVMFADGGFLASKPYAASGAYIDRMSDYCASCHYKVAKKAGAEACPFNYLYWNFLIENRDILSKNQRMSVIYGSLARMTAARRDEITLDAARFLNGLKPWNSNE